MCRVRRFGLLRWAASPPSGVSARKPREFVFETQKLPLSNTGAGEFADDLDDDDAISEGEIESGPASPDELVISDAEIERMGMGEAVDEDDGGIVEA